jgi:hypothetical protein
MKNLILISIILFGVPNVYGQKKPSEKIIKLNLNDQTEQRHFESHDYILSFRLADLLEISNNLNFSNDIITLDTLNFKDFISKIDSTGKGNWTNNYRLNKSFKRLINDGSIKVYSIQSSSYISKLVMTIKTIPGAGEIYYYKDEEKTAIDFWEAFVGTPGF